MKLLAISGWKQSGKDTLSDYLVAKHGATRVSFADPLKDMAAKEYGVPREFFDLPSQKEQPILSLPVSPQDAFSRMIAEFLIKEFRMKSGVQPTEFVYVEGKFLGNVPSAFSKNPDHGLRETVYWTPRALAILKGSSNRTVRSDYWVSQAIDLARARGGVVVISDLRYKSEVAQMREAFGKDMTTLRVQRYATSPSVDPSERELDDGVFDHHVPNRGTLQELYDRMEEIMKTIK